MTNEEKVRRLERLGAEKTSAAKDLKFVFAAETSVAEFTADAAVLREAAQLMRERGALLAGPDWKTMYEAQEREMAEMRKRIAELEAERDALAAQNLELRVALERLIAETDSVDAYMLEVHEAERVLTLPLPAAAAKVAEWKEKAELLEWLESIGGELYRTDSDDGSRKRWAVPGHHGAEGFDSLLSALRAARGAA